MSDFWINLVVVWALWHALTAYWSISLQIVLRSVAVLFGICVVNLVLPGLERFISMLVLHVPCPY